MLITSSFGQAAMTPEFLKQVESYLHDPPRRSLWLARDKYWRATFAYWAEELIVLKPFASHSGNKHDNHDECRNENTLVAAAIREAGGTVVAQDCLTARDSTGKPYTLSASLYDATARPGLGFSLVRGPTFASYGTCAAYRGDKPGLLCLSNRGFLPNRTYSAYSIEKLEQNVNAPPRP